MDQLITPDNQQTTAFQESLNSANGSRLTPFLYATSSNFPTPGSVENEQLEDGQDTEPRNADGPRRGSRIRQPSLCSIGGRHAPHAGRGGGCNC
jgi:hypothetical protein